MELARSASQSGFGGLSGPAVKAPDVLIQRLFNSIRAGIVPVCDWSPRIVEVHFIANMIVGFVSTGPFVVGSAAMLLSVVFAFFWLPLLWLAVAVVGITAGRAVFGAGPGRFLIGAAAAGGLAFINSVDCINGFIGTGIAGSLKDATGSLTAGMAGMAGFLMLSAFFAGRGAALRPGEQRHEAVMPCSLAEISC
jgi:hypothetical protein